MDLQSLAPDELRMFIEEAQEQVQLLDEGIIRLEKEPDDLELLNAIFRAAHTLKGSSGMIGFDSMAQLTHSMEDVLDRVRKHTLSVSPDLIDALLQGLDGLKRLCEIVLKPEAASFDVSSMVAGLTDAAGRNSEAPGSKATSLQAEAAVGWDAEFTARADQALTEGLTVYAIGAHITTIEWAAVRSLQILTALAAAGEVIASDPSRQAIEEERAGTQLRLLFATSSSVEAIRAELSGIADVEISTLAAWQPEDSSPNAEPAETGANTEMGGPKLDALQTVRIDVATLDSLMNMVGELVIDRTRLGQISRALSAVHKEDDLVNNLTTTTTHLVKVVDELNQQMMQARMLPIGMLFNKFPRMVRDLTRSLGKNVDFALDGAETEIDRSVIDKVKDPIVHMLRNAVDHGIEGPEERAAAGKPPEARLRLSAHQEQGHIFITIQDDGRGISVEKVRETAVKRGLLSAEAAERLHDQEALELIFEAGFSTASTTTEVSGRGVGMDVVQRSIAELSGSISIETEPGRGTKFVLRLPLTLATFPGLLVSAAGSAFAIPISFVQETLQMDEGAAQRVMGSEVLNLRGQALPLLRLDADSLLSKDIGSSTKTRFIVVLRSDSRLLGLVVDNLLEQQEVVVKPVGRLASRVRGVAGASILGDGRVALILDITSLLRTSSLSAGTPVESERTAA